MRMSEFEQRKAQQAPLEQRLAECDGNEPDEDADDDRARKLAAPLLVYALEIAELAPRVGNGKIEIRFRRGAVDAPCVVRHRALMNVRAPVAKRSEWLIFPRLCLLARGRLG
jgi:hypothetical protein